MSPKNPAEPVGVAPGDKKQAYPTPTPQANQAPPPHHRSPHRPQPPTSPEFRGTRPPRPAADAPHPTKNGQKCDRGLPTHTQKPIPTTTEDHSKALSRRPVPDPAHHLPAQTSTAAGHRLRRPRPAPSRACQCALHRRPCPGTGRRLSWRHRPAVHTCFG
jgi:hypothetical protein